MDNQPNPYEGQSAADVIDSLGGITKVATLIHAPIGTVFSWKQRGKIPPSRLAHIALAAAAQKKERRK